MSNFVCHVREGLKEETRKKWSEACKKLDVHDEHEGKRYCVLHFPSGDKDLPTFEEAIKNKLKDNNFDFRGVYFPGS